MADEAEIEREREAIYESERQAIRADAQNPAVLEEMRLWESTLEDGIDFDQSGQPGISIQK
jgi:hypothetical protein